MKAGRSTMETALTECKSGTDWGDGRFDAGWLVSLVASFIKREGGMRLGICRAMTWALHGRSSHRFCQHRLGRPPAQS